jgi:hypothetical protein
MERSGQERPAGEARRLRLRQNQAEVQVEAGQEADDGGAKTGDQKAGDDGGPGTVNYEPGMRG